MSKDMMPERWEMPLSCDYRPAANGDWVRAEDVEPLLAEVTRLRARVEVLETMRAAAQALDGYGFGWLHWEEKFEALRAALKEASHE
jgi:hypothetical protein